MIKYAKNSPEKTIAKVIKTLRTIPNCIILAARGLRPRAVIPLEAILPKEKNPMTKDVITTNAEIAYLINKLGC